MRIVCGFAGSYGLGAVGYGWYKRTTRQARRRLTASRQLFFIERLCIAFEFCNLLTRLPFRFLRRDAMDCAKGLHFFKHLLFQA